MTVPVDQFAPLISTLDGTTLPPRLGDALTIVREAIAACDTARIPYPTVLTALMAELMPRLVEVYGPEGVATALGQLAGAISEEVKERMTRQ